MDIFPISQSLERFILTSQSACINFKDDVCKGISVICGLSVKIVLQGDGLDIEECRVLPSVAGILPSFVNQRSPEATNLRPFGHETHQSGELFGESSFFDGIWLQASSGTLLNYFPRGQR